MLVKILATSKLQQICRIHWNYIFPYWEICLDHPKFLWLRILLNESEVSELSWKTCFIYERRSESFINQGSNSRNAVLAYFFRFFKSENFVFWPSWYWNVLPADAVLLSVQTTVRKLICARLWKVSKTKTTKIESCHNFLKISRKYSRTHFCQTTEFKRVVDWPFTNKFRVSVVKNRLGLL